jgi:outer membrane immunogenic protein
MKLPFIIAVIALISTSAFAADMPVKAPTPAPIQSWTGFYAGAELGAEWARTAWKTTSVVDFGTPTAIDASSPRNYNATSARAGLYLGYNRQFAPQWVGGLELDWADANKTTTTAGVPGCSILCLGAPGPVNDLSSVKLGWDGSARARLGYLVAPNVLAYGTGGVAWQHVQTSLTCQFSGPDPICPGIAGVPFSTTTNSLTRTGWTIGAGVDAKVSGNWILRAEYRYASFGTANVVSNLTNPGIVGVTTVAYQLKVNTQIATVGLAYKFSGP